MRLAVLADIHGNYPALEAVVADMKQFSPDHVLVVGDLINLCPFSHEVVCLVREQGWTVVRGNHEYYFLEYQTAREPVSRKAWTLQTWLRDQLTAEDTAFIAKLPDTISLQFPGTEPIRLWHGLPHNPYSAITRLTPPADVKTWLQDCTESVYISGHYHLNFERRLAGKQLLNPGAAGVPLDGSTDAGYLLLDSTADGWQTTFRRVPYDVRAVLEAFEQQHFVEQVGTIGRVIVEQIRTARPVIGTFPRWHRKQYPTHPNTFETIPSERFDEFLRLDSDWDYTSRHYQFHRDDEKLFTSQGVK